MEPVERIFKDLRKLGYDHYTVNTVEELDDLPLNSEERTMEQSLVLKWFRGKYLFPEIYVEDFGGCVEFSFKIKNSEMFTIHDNFSYGGGSYEGSFNSYEEAEIACIKKLIEILKTTKWH